MAGKKKDVKVNLPEVLQGSSVTVNLDVDPNDPRKL